MKRKNNKIEDEEERIKTDWEGHVQEEEEGNYKIEEEEEGIQD